MFNAKFRVRVGAVRRPRCMFFICSLWVSGLGLLLGSCLPTHPHLSEGGDWGPTSFTGLDLILLSPRQAFNL